MGLCENGFKLTCGLGITIVFKSFVLNKVLLLQLDSFLTESECIR